MDGAPTLVTMLTSLFVMHDGMTGLSPASVAAVHGEDRLVPHPLKILGGERGSKSTAAVENNLGLDVGNDRLNISFYDALAQMQGLGQMTGGNRGWREAGLNHRS